MFNLKLFPPQSSTQNEISHDLSLIGDAVHMFDETCSGHENVPLRSANTRSVTDGWLQLLGSEIQHHTSPYFCQHKFVQFQLLCYISLAMQVWRYNWPSNYAWSNFKFRKNECWEGGMRKTGLPCKVRSPQVWWGLQISKKGRNCLFRPVRRGSFCLASEAQSEFIWTLPRAHSISLVLLFPEPCPNLHRSVLIRPWIQLTL